MLVFVSSVVVCIPNSINIAVYRQSLNDSGQLTANSTNAPPPDSSSTAAVWKVDFKLATHVDRFIHSLNFWIQAVVRLGPCFVLTVLSALLVRTMKLADARLRSLESGSTHQRVRRQRATNRTTRMLLAIVILFLITELPQGVSMILSSVSTQFTEGIYLNLGDLFDILALHTKSLKAIRNYTVEKGVCKFLLVFFDILALINSAVNFLLFCTMSRQFRKTFVAVFCHSRRQTVSSRSGRMIDEQY